MPTVSVRDLTKVYATSNSGVRDITLAVADGEHFGIVGPSGAGKTTLLRLIAGLEDADAGSVEINGRDVTSEPPHLRGVAFLTQRPALYPFLDVAANLAAGVGLRQASGRWRRWWRGEPDPVSPKELNDRVAEVADILGLENLLRRRPHELSGGEQQRVALGRAVVAQAGLWLLDEPLAHLDPFRRREIRRQLHLLRRRSAATILEVSHDPVEARTWDRVAVLADGRVDQAGFSAEVYARPATVAAARSLGWPPINMIDAETAGWVDPPWPGCALGLRPERVFDHPAPGRRPLGDWELTRCEPFGPLWLWTVERPGLAWSIWHGRPSAAGERLTLWADPADARRFDPATGRGLDD